MCFESSKSGSSKRNKVIRLVDITDIQKVGVALPPRSLPRSVSGGEAAGTRGCAVWLGAGHVYGRAGGVCRLRQARLCRVGAPLQDSPSLPSPTRYLGPRYLSLGYLPVGQRLASSPGRGGGCGQRAERVLTRHYPPVAREAPAPRGRRRREQPATPTPESSAGFLRVWPRGVSAFGGRGRARLPHPLVTESIPVPHLWLGSQARRVSPPVGPAEEAEEALGVGGGPWVWAGGSTLPDRPW